MAQCMPSRGFTPTAGHDVTEEFEQLPEMAEGEEYVHEEESFVVIGANLANGGSLSAVRSAGRGYHPTS